MFSSLGEEQEGAEKAADTCSNLDKPGDRIKKFGKKLSGREEIAAIRNAASCEWEAATRIMENRSEQCDGRVLHVCVNPICELHNKMIRDTLTQQQCVNHYALRASRGYVKVVMEVLQVLGDTHKVARCGLDMSRSYGVFHEDMHGAASRMSRLSFSLASRLTLAGEYYTRIEGSSWITDPIV